MGDGGKPPEQGRPTDYRGMVRRHERSTVLMAVVLLVIGGGALIGVFFGPGAILTAFPFLILGGAGIVGVYLLWVWLERWANG
jgi:hypothetical protein